MSTLAGVGARESDGYWCPREDLGTRRSRLLINLQVLLAEGNAAEWLLSVGCGHWRGEQTRASRHVRLTGKGVGEGRM